MTLSKQCRVLLATFPQFDVICKPKLPSTGATHAALTHLTATTHPDRNTLAQKRGKLCPASLISSRIALTLPQFNYSTKRALITLYLNKNMAEAKLF